MDAAFEKALKAISQRGTDLHNKVVSALFKQPLEQHLDFVFNIENGDELQDYGYESLLTKAMVRSKLCLVFRRHGAVETQRPAMIPRTGIYSQKVFEVIDANGGKLMLPYDIVLPHARFLARKGITASKTFTFSSSYRPTGGTKGNPVAYSEAGFDIVSSEDGDFALQEAEVIKVISEVMNSLAFVKPSKCLIHINHGSLLDLILEFCRVPTTLKDLAKETLSKLHISGYGWDNLTSELRQIGVATTSLDDLSKFDWRDDYETAFEKMKRLFKPGVRSDRYSSIFKHIDSVMTYLKRFGVNHKIFLNPLGTYSHSFYKNALMFQCVFETSSNAREVAAAGGRYDQLILAHKPGVALESGREMHAVGFHMPLKLLYAMAVEYARSIARSKSKKNAEHTNFANIHRVDVVVASFDKESLRNQGLQILQELWTANINAELAIDSSGLEKLVQHYKGTGVSFIVVVKAPTMHASVSECHIKIKDLHLKEEIEVKYSQLVATLQCEIKARDDRAASHGKSTRGHKEQTNVVSGLHVYPVLPEKKRGKVGRNAMAVDNGKRIVSHDLVHVG